jgi:chromosome segregation ATPase
MNTTLFDFELMQEKLDEISRHMEGEVLTKQVLIDRQYAEIHQLRKKLSEKDSILTEVKQSLHYCRQQTEGHQQLVNKLLNDITQYQNDIEWYKRTYEKRTFLGVIKQKLFKQKAK